MPAFGLMVAYCCLVVFASFISGLTGFGSAIVFQTGWALLGQLGLEGAGELKSGVAVTFIGGLTAAAVMGRESLRDGDIRWDLVTALTPGLIIVNFAGTAALATLAQDGLKKALGLLFLVFACYQLYNKCGVLFKASKAEQIQLIADCKLYAQSAPNMANGESSFELQDLALTSTDDLLLQPTTIISQVEVQETQTTKSHEYDSVTQDAPPLAQTNELGSSVGELVTIDVPSTPASIELVQVEPLTSDPSLDATKGTTECPSGPVTAVGVSFRTFALSPAMWLATLKVLIRRREFQAALAVGCVAGFLGGCFGTNGPPIMAFFSMIPITKGQVRGTFAWSTLLLSIPKLISMLVFSIFDSDDWLMYVLMAPLTMFGTWFGGVVHRLVDVNAVMMMLQGLVLLSTVALCSAFDGSTFGDCMIVVYCIIIIIIASFTIYLRTRTRFFIKQHPEYAEAYIAIRDEKAIQRAHEKMARQQGQEYTPPAPLLFADGSLSGYTVFHE